MSVLDTDTFAGRTVAGGLGTASDGNVWTVFAGASFLSVGGGVGEITNTTSGSTVYLTANTPADLELLTQFTPSNRNDLLGFIFRYTTPNGGSYYLLRYGGSNGIYLSNRINGTSSAITHWSTGTITGGVTYWLKVRCVGTFIAAKMWAVGTQEPTDWTGSTTDSSVAGAGYYGFNGNLAAISDTVTFAQFQAEDATTPEMNDYATGADALGPVAVIAFSDSGAGADASAPTVAPYFAVTDTFIGRTVASGWGTASDGTAWAQGGGTGGISVASGEGQITNGVAAIFLPSGLVVADVAAQMRVHPGTPNLDYAGFYLRHVNGSNYYALRYFGQFGTLALTKLVAGVSTTVTFASGLGTLTAPYWLRAQVMNKTISMWVWEDGQSMPSAPTGVLSDSDITSAGAVGILTISQGVGAPTSIDSFLAWGSLADDGQGTDAATPAIRAPRLDAGYGLDSSGPAVVTLAAIAEVGAALDGAPLFMDAGRGADTINAISVTLAALADLGTGGDRQGPAYADSGHGSEHLAGIAVAFDLGGSDAGDSFLRPNQVGLGGAWHYRGAGANAHAIASDVGVLAYAGPPALDVLGSLSGQDAELLARWTPASLFDAFGFGVRIGASVYAALYCAQGGLFYLSYVGGALSEQRVIGSGNVVAGQPTWMRARIVCTQVFAKVWADGIAEPDWQGFATITDVLAAGNLGLYVQTANPGQVVAVDSLAIAAGPSDSGHASDLTTSVKQGACTGGTAARGVCSGATTLLAPAVGTCVGSSSARGVCVGSTATL